MLDAPDATPYLPAMQATARTNTVRLRLSVNGEQHETAAATLGELIAALGYGTGKIATAVNGAFVAERARARHALADGDEIEIVAPRQGG